jgi:hypothetical protein
LFNSVLRKLSSHLSESLVAMGALTVAALVTGFVLWPKSPINLAEEGPQARAQLLQQWNAGEHAAKDAEYGSALFVRIDGNGQLQVLGIVNAEDWNTLRQEKD